MPRTDTDTTPPPTTTSAVLALAKLEKHLCADQIEMLASLLDDVFDDSGWGTVKIVVADKRVVRLKAEKSY